MSFRRASSIVALLAGCFPQVVGPKPAVLDAKQATALDLVAVGGRTSYCLAGEPVQLKAVVTLADGKRLETWSAGQDRDGKLEFATFEFSTSFGQVDAEGYLRLPDDPFASIGKVVTIEGRVGGRADLVSKVTLASAFDCGGFVAAGGAGGQGGLGGNSGMAGNPGRSGDSSTQATDGEPGGHGQDAGNGGPGENGAEIEVALGYVDAGAQGRLVVARVGQAYFLFDPKGQPFAISADGGSGGGGGDGGSGGNGGDGGSNNVEGGGDGGSGGDGGNGGNGGSGGDGGDGGGITVAFDARSPELVDFVRSSTAAGSGGNAGSGGYAGSGGSAGSSTSGRSGTAGRQGQPGQPGMAGRPGRQGRGARAQPVDVRQLFAPEIARGLPIAVP